MPIRAFPLAISLRPKVHMSSWDELRNVRAFACGAFLFCVLPLGVSSQESELKPVKKVAPVYPDVLKKMGISGTVHLKVVVATDGSVKDIEVHGGSAIFAESASKAVKQWRYAPGGKDRIADVSVEFECCTTVKTSP